MIEAFWNLDNDQVLTRNDETQAWHQYTDFGPVPITSTEAWHILQTPPLCAWRSYILPGQPVNKEHYLS